jgi:benzodiazapine receptor
MPQLFTIMLILRPYFRLLLFILIVAGVSFSGAQFRPGDWYAGLIKPDWTPPNWIFPVVWSVLYLMIAVAGWLIFAASNRTLKILWVIQLALNGLWSWIFFGMHLIGLGMIDILAIFFCTLILLAFAYKFSRAVVWLMAPYLLWIGYASALNVAIYFLNPV